MTYAGSDGADSRLHIATSPDGHGWEGQGTFMQRGEADAVGATHPCLLVTSERWWLFYSGYDGSDNGRRASILAGVFWHRQGIALTGSGEDVDTLGVRSPCVLRLHDGTLRLWYAGRPPGNVEAAYRLCSADFTRKDEWLAAV